MKAPTFTLVAGTNGAGKSTLTSTGIDTFASHPNLDPDFIERSIDTHLGENTSMAAGRVALEQAEAYLRQRVSFSVETTLAGKNYLNMMRRAKALGYDVELLYVGTESVEINLARIAKRVLGGGHNIPEDTVRRRYQRSFDNLSTTIRLADEVILFDNSQEDIGYKLVGYMKRVDEDSFVFWATQLPVWAQVLEIQFPATDLSLLKEMFEAFKGFMQFLHELLSKTTPPTP